MEVFLIGLISRMKDKDKEAEMELLIELAKESGVMHEKSGPKLNKLWAAIADKFREKTGKTFTGKELSRRVANR